MPTGLEQIGLAYDQAEDRLRLRVVDRSQGELHLFLTRRMAIEWCRQLATAAVRSTPVPADASAATRNQWVSGTQRVASPDHAIHQQRQPEREMPPARLVVAVKGGRHRTNAEMWRFQFSSRDGTSIVINLSTSSMRGLIELLRKTLKKTDWGINFFPEPPSQPAAAVSRLH